MKKELLETFLGTFECSPEVIKEEIESGEVVEKLILKGTLQKANTLNQNGRIYPREILEREVRNYQKFINERRALGELDHPDTCVPLGSLIYTSEGWKKIEEISEDEVVLTINPETEEVEFEKIQKKIEQEFSGNLVRIKNNKTMDFSFTPNHRVMLWDRNEKSFFAHAKEILSGNIKDIGHCAMRFSSKGIKNVDSPKKFKVGEKEFETNDWAKFLGIYLSEGSCVGTKQPDKMKRSCPMIHQSKDAHPEVYESIKDLLVKMNVYVKSTDRIHYCDESLYDHLVRLGNSRTKYVPDYVNSWSVDDIKTLCEWMLKGDGRNTKPWTDSAKKRHDVIWGLYTTSPQLAQDFEKLMYMIGSGSTTSTRIQSDRKAPDFSETGRMILEENSAPMHLINERVAKSMSMDSRFTSVFEEKYEGKIYCVVTKNQTWLLKQNDKVCWTGNSVVSLQNVSHVITKAVFEGDVVKGEIEVLDKVPSGKILKGLVESNIKLGISSRGVGTTVKDGDYLIVQPDFQLICWDMVSEPSTPGAFMLPEGKNYVLTAQDERALKNFFTKEDRIDRILNELLTKSVNA